MQNWVQSSAIILIKSDVRD